MKTTRSRVLSAIHAAYRTEPPAEREARVAQWLSAPPVGPAFSPAQIEEQALVPTFLDRAQRLAATCERLEAFEAIPAAVARYLTERGELAAVRLAHDEALLKMPWQGVGLRTVTFGPARDQDRVGVICARAAVAETGAVMIASASTSPTLMALLPEICVVAVRESDIVARYEQAWKLLDGSSLPRWVGFVGGPSRTADIEEVMQLGAHGPKALHILIVAE